MWFTKLRCMEIICRGARTSFGGFSTCRAWTLQEILADGLLLQELHPRHCTWEQSGSRRWNHQFATLHPSWPRRTHPLVGRRNRTSGSNQRPSPSIRNRCVLYTHKKAFLLTDKRQVIMCLLQFVFFVISNCVQCSADMITKSMLYVPDSLPTMWCSNWRSRISYRPLTGCQSPCNWRATENWAFQSPANRSRSLLTNSPNHWIYSGSASRRMVNKRSTSTTIAAHRPKLDCGAIDLHPRIWPHWLWARKPSTSCPNLIRTI